MTAAIHSIVNTARKASREAELSVLHVQAIIAELRVQLAELRRDRDLWHDLAEAWIERRLFDGEQAQRLAERAAIRAERAVTSR
jgi:hypothetical protein